MAGAEGGGGRVVSREELGADARAWRSAVRGRTEVRGDGGAL